MTWAGGRKIAGLRDLVVATYGATCWLCGRPCDVTMTGPRADRLTIDHVLPRSRGGGDEIENLRPAHYSCNSARGAGPGRRGRPRSRRRACPVDSLLSGPATAPGSLAGWLAGS